MGVEYNCHVVDHVRYLEMLLVFFEPIYYVPLYESSHIWNRETFAFLLLIQVVLWLELCSVILGHRSETAPP